MASSTEMPADHDWRDSTHELYYPTSSTAVPVVTTDLIGRPWNSKSFLEEGQEQLKKDKKLVKKNKTAAKYPLRTELPALISPQTILTNHFEITTDAADLYEYEILDLEGEGRTKKKVQALFKRALEAWTHLNNDQANFATDNQKTIVSWVNLHQNLTTPPQVPGDAANENAGAVWPSQNITTGNNPVAARLKFVGKVPIGRLHNQTMATLSEVHTDLAAVERCLNIIISKSFDAEVYRHSVDKFFVKKARKTLYREQNKIQYHSQSLEIMRGYYYTIKPGMGCLLMNFNVATSAFFRPVLVSEFLADSETFPDLEERIALLSKLRVYVDPKHSQQRLNNFGARIKSIHSIGDNNNPDEKIEDLSFVEKVKGTDGKPLKDPQGNFIFRTIPTKVTDHIRSSFGLTAMTGRKAVNVGTATDPVWYAQEHLRIVPYQIFRRPVPEHLTSSMVNQAALNPGVAQTLIEREGLAHLGFNEVKNEKVGFRNGAPLSLYPTMMRVEAGRMPFPSVTYKWNQHHKENSKKSLSFKQSVWNIEDDHQFHEPKISAMRYYVIHQLQNRHITPTIANFETELLNQLGRKCGLANTQVVRVNPGNNAATIGSGENLQSKMAEAVSLKADLVILMLSYPDRHVYAHFKKLADKQFGIRSLCVAKPSHLETLGTDQITKYMSNITQKINIKFGGINASVEYISDALGKNTLVLGADVIHPGIGAYENSPSIACIVGSVDHEAGRFLGSARLQSKDKTDREIIDHVQEMVEERIRAWMVATGSAVPPQNFIYYRDGVSKGQYSRVISVELAAIGRAAEAVRKRSNTMTMGGGKGTKITALVGVKRHHTRFYPIDANSKDGYGNNNCNPGTYVDRTVTSPYFRDFYLQSHSGIKGTARPTHYFVLRDDGIASCTNTANLRKLTHHLCYTYCRATTGVSYAAPTYYADRLCDRARLYLLDTWAGRDATFLGTLNTAKANEPTRLQTDRDARYRGGRAFDAAAGDVKSNAEIDEENAVPQAVRAHLRALVLARAQAEFYSEKPAGTTTGNPWHESLDKVMFWM
ncbi:uncharacterized protein J4E88_009246 [Alternaria novae-zelandiae]|uniref:uncharacterized protein n=1 Tax=Alternaria novae-zelandiae TaxID=430562 RepID=UPI0020C46C53|nr:uncharacterized protein J4E88_009246 [Alternaria novae-zelandiae]KAI4671213.1 hypothetical protein J4E88_009246 [Alternaria novae-zelandiae]